MENKEIINKIYEFDKGPFNGFYGQADGYTLMYNQWPNDPKELYIRVKIYYDKKCTNKYLDRNQNPHCEILVPMSYLKLCK